MSDLIYTPEQFPVSDYEWQAALESMDLAGRLQRQLTRINKIGGISIPDKISVESISPGLLSKANQEYTYRPTVTNLIYSQEAIGEQIQNFLAKGKVVFDKIIKWIREQSKRIKNTFTRARFELMRAKLNKALSGDSDRLSVRDTVALLKGDTISFDKHRLTQDVGKVVGNEVKLSDFNNVPKRSNVSHWAAGLDSVMTQRAKPIPDISVASGLAQDVLNGLRYVETEMKGPMGSGNAAMYLKNTFSVKDPKGSIRRVSVGEMTSFVNNDRYLLDLHKHLTEIESAVTRVERLLDQDKSAAMAQRPMDEVKEQRNKAYETLRAASSLVAIYGDALNSCAAVTTFITFSLDYVTKFNVDRVLNAGDLSSD